MKIEKEVDVHIVMIYYNPKDAVSAMLYWCRYVRYNPSVVPNGVRAFIGNCSAIKEADCLTLNSPPMFSSLPQLRSATSIAPILIGGAVKGMSLLL